MSKSFQILIPLLSLLIGSTGCGLFPGKTAEIELPATEVGTPLGDKVTKDIGPAGGTLASPDGRLALTIPENALTETLTFSIQPITNKAEPGIGNAYRLEPSGKTFTTPLAITIRYNDHDLEGTVPEALAIAYQDEQRSWHLVNESKIDESAKTLTILASHFTDWSFLAKIHITPQRATLRVGETLKMEIGECLRDDQLVWISRYSQPTNHFCHVTDGQYNWGLHADWFADAGTIDDHSSVKIVYTAPLKKPTPNDVTVSYPYWATDHRGMFTAHITIVDRVYRATGIAGSTVFSGIICDLERSFTLKTNNQFLMPLEFTPSSENGGTWAITTTSGVSGGGGGKYTVDGPEGAKTGISMSGSSTGSVHGITRSGGGDFHINLTPLDGNEGCGE